MILIAAMIGFSCGNTNRENVVTHNNNSIAPNNNVIRKEIPIRDSILQWVKVPEDILVKNYFKFMDKLILKADTFKNWHINEYILVHANPWILDSLRSFDYYEKMEEGIFVYDQRELIILHKNDSLAIPDSAFAWKISKKLETSVIDVNLPEFKLRLFQNGDTIFTCPVRVGRDGEKFIFVVGHIINLRTPIGIGEIKWIDRMHKVINLDTGKEYTGTNRDDKHFTKIPIIPWIEPAINGIRYGVMIHPTTNPETLGKAYSHGCIGTNEKDAWTIYYNAPKGTKVIFRYDLKVLNEKGDTIVLNDIYHLFD